MMSILSSLKVWLKRAVLYSLALVCAQSTSVFAAQSGAVLPGIAAFPTDLQRRLAAALAAKTDAYAPRTHHLEADGSPKYTNRLILESSPYLLQHAHNPVNWYAWGAEAFETAKRLNRPVLLSVGYSTCHWCHVMERESFEDEEIAEVINKNYIAIKVDREERPDIDAIYMTAVQLLTGRGGWPMTVWLTPEGVPFYAGTYFPARDGDRGAEYGFLTYIRVIQENYAKKPDDIVAYSRQVSAALKDAMGATTSAGAVPGADVLDSAVAYYEENFDPFHGGIAGAPKFPSSLSVPLLLRYHRRSGKREFLDMAALTLRQMSAGGINDQIGGGFHRYSVDNEWRVPHFEKMLYDNALLAMTYLEGYQASGDTAFAAVARSILDYVVREMTSAEGGFYSATDADSLNPQGHFEEGWFFTWTAAEIDALLEADQAELVKAFYGISETGNFAGRNILHRRESLTEIAVKLELEAQAARRLLDAAHQQLYAARSSRPAPLRDEKILTSWNGLMISALARAGWVLNHPAYLQQAKRAADFILRKLRNNGRLLRSYTDGTARHNAYLEDYAFLIAGLLDINEASAESRWLEEAIVLQQMLDKHYLDAEQGGYFRTSDDHEALLVREKSAYDSAQPSGNSVALMNLLRLYEFTTQYSYQAKAEQLLKAFGSRLKASPAESAVMLLAHDFYLDEVKEIIIVTPHSRRDAEPFLSVLRQTFLPNKVLIVAAEGDDLKHQAKLIPLLQGKKAAGGKTTAYVCTAGLCKLPTQDVGVFVRQLSDSG